MKGFLRNIKGRFIFQITSTIPSRSCEARVRLFVLGMVLEDGHVREVYILYFVLVVFLYDFVLFYSISFLVVFLLNNSIIHLSSFFIMNFGIRTNRKWN